ncbi:MAG: type I-G CRISPR-associated protein Cas8g1/Csx17 [Solirubrobacteraceae bacterium]
MSPDPSAPARLTGCRTRPLVNYLKGLGVLRVVTRQADPRARGRWFGPTFELRSSLERSGLEPFFLDRYAPSPVVSPWNGGSGFFPGDNVEGFRRIEASDDDRVTAFRAAIRAARGTLRSLGLDAKPADKSVKLALIRELRATLPDEALEWLDAAVVLLGPELAYPPLLGSGGNDGRYDFANNFARAVGDALALGGAESARDTAASWLRAALWGSSASLKPKLSAGHLFRDASPVMSPTGEADALGNPWDLVLALEGSLVLAAGAARRHGAGVDASLVAPFTVRTTAAGYGSAVAGEAGRAELWLPLWTEFAALSEIDTLVREARAQVGRRQARTGLDLARAASEMGVARGVSAFERYAVLERAGQSSLAVPTGRIEVRLEPAVLALRTLDPWLDSILRYGKGDCPAAQRRAIARLERLAFVFADHGSPSAACALLEALGEVESCLARAGRRVAAAGLRPLGRVSAGPWLRAADDETPEFSMAVALGSLHDPKSTGVPALRDYLHGTSVDARGRRVYVERGEHVVARNASPVDRLAGIHVRRHLDAAHARRHHDPDGEDRDGGDLILGFRYGRPAPLALASRFASGVDLDDRRVVRLVEGLALLDYSEARWYPSVASPPAPAPLFEVLALAWAGTPEARLAPRPGWAARLRAGAVATVVKDALLRLQLGDLPPIIEHHDVLTSPIPGPRLAAGLLVNLGDSDRLKIARRLTRPPSTPEQPPDDRAA